MTKTAKAAPPTCSSGVRKVAAKTTAPGGVPTTVTAGAAVRKKAMTKAQADTVAETIAYVIKSKHSKQTRRPAPAAKHDVPSRNQPKLTLAKAKKQATTAKKTTATKKADVNKSKKTITPITTTKHKVKPSEIKDNKEKIKKEVPKKDDKHVDRSPTRSKDKLEQKEKTITSIDKKETPKTKKPVKLLTPLKVAPMVAKKQKLNKLKQRSPDSKVPKNIRETKEQPKKQKCKIKEEQLDEVITAILKSSEEKSETKVKDPVKKKPLPTKLSPSLMAKKLKAKLTSVSLNNKPFVKSKSKTYKNKMAAKNADKGMQQVKARKLLSMWNGPKRHRVASLNAMAKVHCLYDNEFRGNFDQIDAPRVKGEGLKSSERDMKRSRMVKHERESVSPQPTRTLRSVPGLRAVGKMWDMHDTTSSSDEDEFIQRVVQKRPVRVVEKLEKAEKVEKMEKVEKKSPPSKSKKTDPVTPSGPSPTVKRRKKDEIVMDLKDMVVRKRMASLNASAILAASYSIERRRNKNGETESGSSDDDLTSSSDEVYSSDEAPLKRLEDIKQEAKVDVDCTVIEVRPLGGVVPNKKVAVIVNQDTDVTFTGVYMNSTTRSTHHEGYCHIAGMKYRISATSHTQTAATAVATETILQSTTTTTHDNEGSVDAAPVKSYTPLDALSSMQPPPSANAAQPHHHLPPSAAATAGGGAPQQQHPPPPPPAPQQQQPHHHHHHLHHGHHHGGPHDLGTFARRHGCATSAFSAPPPPPGHHHMPPTEHHGYVQGYYQPAGPLISVHGHSQAPLPPPTLGSKSVPLSDASPTSTSPLLQPPPPSSAGDSSDSEVIITSVTTAKEALASQHQPPPLPPTYHHRLNHHYPPPPPHGAYSAYGTYPPQYYGAPQPPPPPGPAAYPHPHDMCYTSFAPHKYAMFRRYVPPPPGPPYYPQPGSPDLYAQPPSANQQVVTATSSASSGSYQSSSTGPPPPTLMEPYPGPPPATLIETYPPPSHYYPGYGPAPTCYTQRPLNYINATYQTCPCPMQSCPKNVHTGPLAGDSKRSNIAIANESMPPLPPVALALPLEPASATGPPSPARGSAGMPPPPSPAGATYQPPPAAPPPKQEPSPEPAGATTCPNGVQRRKARIGKAMVRNTIAQSQQNTMLLMCQRTITTPPMKDTPMCVGPTILENVKREVESPEVKRILVDKMVEEKKCEVIVIEHENSIKCEKPETPPNKLEATLPSPSPPPPPVETKACEPLAESVSPPSPPPSPLSTTTSINGINETQAPSVDEELLLPCQKTVAENVKVKNMKRKCSISKEAEPEVTPTKKTKLDATAGSGNKPNGSYKDLIKKTQNVVKINNGRRKLITETRTVNGVLIRIKKSGRRKLRPLSDGNVPQSPLKSAKVNGVKDAAAKAHVDPELIENKEPNGRRSLKKAPPTLAVACNNKQNNVDRTIESVVHNLRTHKVVVTETNVAKSEKVTTNNGAKKIAAKVTKSSKVSMRRNSKPKQVPQTIPRLHRRSAQQLRWSNGWRWHGEPFDGKVFLNSDEATVMRKCYPAMVHEEGDIIEPRDCVLLKAGQRKNELPFVAKIAALWENPDDGEMMMSLLWYYRPEHTEQGRRPVDQPDEVFASRHKDSNSVACIEDKCYVLTYNEYCRYRKDLRRIDACVEDTGPCIPQPDPYPRLHRQPPSTLGTSADLVFFCRKVYDFRQKRIIKNPS